MRTLFVVASFCFFLSSRAQVVKGVIADSATRTALSFATVQTNDGKHSVISGINGRFSITIPLSYTTLHISHIGYRRKIYAIPDHKQGDTIFLGPASDEMNEVVIYSNYDKIRRIINTAVRNKDKNNPDKYNAYECNIYYKTHLSLAGFDFSGDSSSLKKDTSAYTGVDTSAVIKDPRTTVLISETYTKRVYKNPDQLQEVVMASKFSGIKKTYFSNLVTDVLPFHVYDEYIPISGRDYSNPIAKGWQQRYKFQLSQELFFGKDTVFLLEFEPRNTTFNGLRGLVYINSNGYAISHFIGSTADTSADRIGRIEHIYTNYNGRWFPKELNYNILIRRFFQKQGEMRMNGLSVIDSVYFDKPPSIPIDKAHSIKISDSVDLRSEEDWNRYRLEPISENEKRAYARIDSMSQEYGLEKKILKVAYLATGRFPVGKIDIDVSRIFAGNSYEGTRLGFGFFTNNEVSKYISLGGWAGYGFRDEAWKYGGSLTFYPSGTKENRLSFSYQKSIRNPGEVTIHPEITRTGLRNWLLGKVDDIEQYQAMASVRKGYWELQPGLSKTTIRPLYENNFIVHGLGKEFNNRETSLGVRYAYGEKRVPLFDYYTPLETKYPMVYLKFAYGELKSGSYNTSYGKLLSAVTYRHHINRWGRDNYRLEGGMLHSFEERPLPLSVLLAGNGIRMKGLNYYGTGGFITMRPYDYFSDRYISFLYKHDFDWYIWDLKLSKPSVSVAHNMVYGSLQQPTKLANPELNSFTNGYHETGILLNQILRKNLRFTDLNLDLGAFYNWKGTPTPKNMVGVFAISATF